jgi:hypothetical protein
VTTPVDLPAGAPASAGAERSAARLGEPAHQRGIDLTMLAADAHPLARLACQRARCHATAILTASSELLTIAICMVAGRPLSRGGERSTPARGRVYETFGRGKWIEAPARRGSLTSWPTSRTSALDQHIERELLRRREIESLIHGLRSHLALTHADRNRAGRP